MNILNVAVAASAILVLSIFTPYSDNLYSVALVSLGVVGFLAYKYPPESD